MADIVKSHVAPWTRKILALDMPVIELTRQMRGLITADINERHNLETLAAKLRELNVPQPNLAVSSDMSQPETATCQPCARYACLGSA